MDAHLRHVFFNQCSTPKTRDTLIYALPPKTRYKMDAHCLMSTLINPLPRKLVILNGRTFAECPL